MKAAYATSIIGHVLLLSWGLIALPSAQPFEVEAIDALPVDIIPISDTTKLSEGVKTAPKRETASQQPVKNPTPRPDSQRAGNAPTEQKTPVTETATETAAAREAKPAAPPPPPAPERPPEPPKAPEPAPPKTAEPPPAPPAPAPERTEVAALNPEPPKAEVGEIVAKPEEPKEETPAPAPPTALPKARPKPPAPEPVQTAKAEEEPTPPKKAEPAKPVEPKPVAEPKPEEKEFDPNELAALLNKVDPSGGGARASTDEASLGSEQATGSVPEMSQNELDALRARLIACWNPPIGGDGSENMAVPVRFQLNPDGTLASEPVAQSIPAGPLGMVMAESATRAVRKCAPFDFLPADKYEAWRVVNINFDPREMY